MYCEFFLSFLVNLVLFVCLESEFNILLVMRVVVVVFYDENVKIDKLEIGF